MFENQERQLELFDVANTTAPRPRRDGMGRLLLHLRYDQFLLVGIAGVIGITVVFACGVERGKQLARAERPLLPVPVATSSTVQEPVKPATPAPMESAARARPKPETATPSAPKLKTPVRVASDAAKAPAAASHRYAVQVASYDQPQLAKQALARLQARGERAFLIIREGRTIVYAGPFPSKGHASEKVASLKSQYRDCFVRSL